MPTFQRCDPEVDRLARHILNKFETHKPLLECEASIDFVFAYADTDDKTGERVNDALTKNGVRALGIARAVPPKDRALGRRDAEISIDGDWWKEASAEEKEALLDHEIHHLVPKTSKGVLVRDDKGRPMLRIRPHDYEVGWFNIIAQRHGHASQEVQMAKRMMDKNGQQYWPDLFTEGTANSEVTTALASRFSSIAKEMKAKKP